MNENTITYTVLQKFETNRLTHDHNSVEHERAENLITKCKHDFTECTIIRNDNIIIQFRNNDDWSLGAYKLAGLLAEHVINFEKLII